MSNRPRPPYPRKRATPQPSGAGPEQALRRQLHAHGLRFARQTRDLPGAPDIVLPRRRTVVFVHGCFWHGHDCKHGSVAAKFNAGFWAEKITANRERDRRQRAALHALGWHAETVWECQLDDAKAINRLAARLRRR